MDANVGCWTTAEFFRVRVSIFCYLVASLPTYLPTHTKSRFGPLFYARSSTVAVSLLSIV
jgi:hypothetical protein